MTPRRMLLIATGVLAGLALAFALVLFPPGGATEPEPGEEFLLPAPLPAPDFELVAHTGEAVRLHELGENRVLAIFFGYSNCPDVCPLTMANLGRARADLGENAERVLVVLITVDPARDSVAQLAEYVQRFPTGIVALTGPEETLAAAAKAYLAYVERAPDSGHEHGTGGYLVDHSGRTLLVRGDRIVMTFPPGTPAPDMAAGFALALRR